VVTMLFGIIAALVAFMSPVIVATALWPLFEG
jgi:hypothetical protein